MAPQVSESHYRFEKYCQLERWSSYWHQLDEILRRDPQSVVEIGVGDKVVAHYLKEHVGVAYTSVDIAHDLHPDVVASIEQLPFESGSFDIACAFEVLEHLPFEKFESAVRELGRVAKRYVVMSVPHWGRHVSLAVRLPFFGRIQVQKKFSLFPKRHVFNGQHYWEIGKRGYPLKRILNSLKNTGLAVETEYVVFESPYHHFFILKKK